MSMPIVKSSNTSRYQAVTDIIESVALEQTAISHILNAEGEGIQNALEPCATIELGMENHLRAYDFVYLGVVPYLGFAIDGVLTAIIQITDSISGLNTLTYCFDVETYIQNDEHYMQLILQQSTDITTLDANRVRSILLNAFPYISVAAVAVNSGVATLT